MSMLSTTDPLAALPSENSWENLVLSTSSSSPPWIFSTGVISSKKVSWRRCWVLSARIGALLLYDRAFQASGAADGDATRGLLLELLELVRTGKGLPAERAIGDWRVLSRVSIVHYTVAERRAVSTALVACTMLWICIPHLEPARRGRRIVADAIGLAGAW